jgi:hypothetical protein
MVKEILLLPRKANCKKIKGKAILVAGRGDL